MASVCGVYLSLSHNWDYFMCVYLAVNKVLMCYHDTLDEEVSHWMKPIIIKIVQLVYNSSVNDIITTCCAAHVDNGIYCCAE